MIIDALVQPRRAIETGTGWKLEPQGACRDGRCVPLAGAVDGDDVDVVVFAERMSMPLVAAEDHGIWALGPAGGARFLEVADLPEITLPDLDGNPFTLSSLHGQKVLLVAWASW